MSEKIIKDIKTARVAAAGLLARKSMDVTIGIAEIQATINDMYCGGVISEEECDMLVNYIKMSAEALGEFVVKLAKIKKSAS